MVLIVGASSFIGGHVARSYSPGEYLGTYNAHPVDHAVQFDATTMTLEDVLPAGCTFSHAVILFAEPDIDACKADVQRSHELNVRSAKAVIDSALRRGIKPVFMSSEQVFDGDCGGYSEEDTPAPITVYGEQKLEVEEYLARNAADYAVLRLAKVFGTDPADKTIFAGWLRQIHRGDSILCARDQVFSPIHVGDVVASTRAVVSGNLSGTFHLANPKSYSRLDMLKILMARGRLSAEVRECSFRDIAFLDNRARDVSMSPAKILNASGLTFRTIESCCDDLLDADSRMRC
jgi:dTDP-4-dehydrorhamnose reductase